MAWEVPSLNDIAQRTRAAFTTYLPGADTTVWPSNIAVSAKVIAGRVWELFHRQSYIARQAFPLTADGEYLERHAQPYGIARRVEIRSTGNIFIDEGTAGTTIPAGTQWQTAAGDTYSSIIDTVIDINGQATIGIEADNSGGDFNLDGGDQLTMMAVIAGAPADATVSASGVYGGSAIESDTMLRQRLMDRLRQPPLAGSESDYRRWVMDIPGVTRVWVAPVAYGPGTVGIFFAMDNSYANGIPTAADVATVQAYIDTLKPITANVVVAAPTPYPIFIQVSGLNPFTASVLSNVKAELSHMIAEKGGVSTPKKTQYIHRSWIWQAISNATGERYHSVDLPTDNDAIPVGHIAVFDETYLNVSG